MITAHRTQLRRIRATARIALALAAVSLTANALTADAHPGGAWRAAPTAPAPVQPQSQVQAPQPQPNPGISLIATGDKGELVDHLPVVDGRTVLADGNRLHERRVIYSRPIDLRAGDIIVVNAEYEVTNDLGYNVMLAGQVRLVPNAGDTEGGIELTEANGFNVTPGAHHGKMVHVGMYQAPADLGPQHVNVIAYSASSVAQPGAAVTVDWDYGRLSILHVPARDAR